MLDQFEINVNPQAADCNSVDATEENYVDILQVLYNWGLILIAPLPIIIDVPQDANKQY